MMVVVAGRKANNGRPSVGYKYVMLGYQTQQLVASLESQLGQHVVSETGYWYGRQCQKARHSRCSSMDPSGPEYRGNNQQIRP